MKTSNKIVIGYGIACLLGLVVTIVAGLFLR